MAKALIVPPDGGHKFGILPGDEPLVVRFAGDETDGMFEYFEVRPGYLAGPPLHVHLAQHETFHVLSGELHFQLGDQTFDVKAGGCVLIPMGAVHTYVNLQKEPGHAVGIFAPAGFAKFLDEAVTYVSSTRGQPDQAKFAEIAARNKQKWAGPPLAYTMGLKKGWTLG
jgi:mannose-6-phosphate isomerase-like protein (cupin superfamily)